MFVLQKCKYPAVVLREFKQHEIFTKGKINPTSTQKKHGSVLWAVQYVFVDFNMVG